MFAAQNNVIVQNLVKIGPLVSTKALQFQSYPGEGIGGIQQRQFVPFERLYVLNDQTEVFVGLQTQFIFQRRNDIVDRRPGVILERLGLAILQKHFQNIGHGCYAHIPQRERRRLKLPL
jgi:hypothetical protein